MQSDGCGYVPSRRKGVHVNSSNDNVLRRFAVMVAVVATLMLFGASGAQAASTQALAASGSLATQNHDTGDEEEDPSDEETEDPDNEEDSEDSDDEDSDDEDSDEETDEPTDEPTEQPTFTEPTDSTDDITEMPTEDAGATSEEGPSPLGWILLAGGVASAAAAFLVYRRNRPL